LCFVVFFFSLSEKREKERFFCPEKEGKEQVKNFFVFPSFPFQSQKACFDLINELSELMFFISADQQE
jgi:hypothetical protein